MPCLETARLILADHTSNDVALDLLSRPERELVSRVLQAGNPVASGAGESISRPDDIDFLRLAQLRLRNIVEKHSEGLKRARLSARAGEPDNHLASIELRLRICSEALSVCRQRLKSSGGQA